MREARKVTVGGAAAVFGTSAFYSPLYYTATTKRMKVLYVIGVRQFSYECSGINSTYCTGILVLSPG